MYLMRNPTTRKELGTSPFTSLLVSQTLNTAPRAMPHQVQLPYFLLSGFHQSLPGSRMPCLPGSCMPCSESLYLSLSISLSISRALALSLPHSGSCDTVNVSLSLCASQSGYLSLLDSRFLYLCLTVDFSLSLGLTVYFSLSRAQVCDAIAVQAAYLPQEQQSLITSAVRFAGE